MITRVRDKGQITLPSHLRNALKIKKDSVLSVAKVGNAILLTLKPSKFEEVANTFSKEAKKKGITLESLLKDLKRIRHVK
ncbi:AbrB/MazE/SpoVT family DNA-binding domain-containing protein [PVC group bacterium]|nr:AbrB/MazE/SpoVT family DNA-binding domain-containing protein [PVC group bacterium]